MMTTMSGTVPCPVCEELIELQITTEITNETDGINFNTLTAFPKIKAVDLTPMYDHLLAAHGIIKGE